MRTIITDLGLPNPTSWSYVGRREVRVVARVVEGSTSTARCPCARWTTSPSITDARMGSWFRAASISSRSHRRQAGLRSRRSSSRGRSRSAQRRAGPAGGAPDDRRAGTRGRALAQRPRRRAAFPGGGTRSRSRTDEASRPRGRGEPARAIRQGVGNGPAVGQGLVRHGTARVPCVRNAARRHNRFGAEGARPAERHGRAL